LLIHAVYYNGKNTQVKEEIETNPEFFDEYSVSKGHGGMAAPEAQKAPPATATA
jgi:hypothetical protein